VAKYTKAVLASIDGGEIDMGKFLSCNFCADTINGKNIDECIDAGWNWAELKLKAGGKQTIAGCPNHTTEFKNKMVEVCRGSK